MSIFRALGLGLFLLILISLMPRVFTELTSTLVAFLQSMREALTAAGILASYTSHLIPPVP